MIVEEWLVRDQAGMVRQIGLEPAEIAARMAEHDAEAGRGPWHLEASPPRSPCPTRARSCRTAGAFSFARLGVRSGTAPDLAAIRRFCHEAYGASAPGGRSLHGHAQLDAWVVGYLAAFPDARLTFDHFCALEEVGKARAGRDPVLWLSGTHNSHGASGRRPAPRCSGSGSCIPRSATAVSGTSGSLLDELALWKQIRLQSG